MDSPITVGIEPRDAHQLCRVEQTFQPEHRIADALSCFGITEAVGDFAGRGVRRLIVMLLGKAALAVRLVVADTAGSGSVRLPVNQVVKQMCPGSQNGSGLVAAEENRVDFAFVAQQTRSGQHADIRIGCQVGIAGTV